MIFYLFAVFMHICDTLTVRSAHQRSINIKNAFRTHAERSVEPYTVYMCVRPYYGLYLVVEQRFCCTLIQASRHVSRTHNADVSHICGRRRRRSGYLHRHVACSRHLHLHVTARVTRLRQRAARDMSRCRSRHGPSSDRVVQLTFPPRTSQPHSRPVDPQMRSSPAYALLTSNPTRTP